MNNLIFAFPGSGKTTCVKQAKIDPRPGTMGAIDLDIKCPENFKGFNCPFRMRNALTQYVVESMACGLDVYTHIWAIDPFRHYNHCQVIVVVPAANAKRSWTKRICKRGDIDFADQVYENFDSWRREWINFYKVIKMLNPSAKLVKLYGTQFLKLEMFNAVDEKEYE